MKHVVRWNVRNRFVVAFIVVAVVPLVVFGALVYSRTARSLHEVEQLQIEAQATGAREVLRQRMTEERVHIHDYAVWDEFHVALGQHRAQWVDDNVADWVPCQQRHERGQRLRPDRRRGRARRRHGLRVALGERTRAGRPPRQDRRRSREPRRACLRHRRRAHRGPDVPVTTGRACSSSPKPSPTACWRASTGSPAARDGCPCTPAARSRRPPSPAEASPAATFQPIDYAAGQVFTEGDFTNKLVPLRDKQGQTVAQLKVSVRRDAFAAALGEINAITIGAFLVALHHRRRRSARSSPRPSASRCAGWRRPRPPWPTAT